MAAIHWLSGVSGDWSTAANWSGGTVPGSGDDVTIAATGTYTVTISDNEAAHSLVLNNAGATISLGVGGGNTLTMGGALTLTAGTFQLNGGAAIVGGTLSATGGTFDWNGGDLDGVTYDGALNVTAGGAQLRMNGVTLKGTGGTGPGVMNLTGNTANVLIYGGTLDNATLNIGTGGPNQAYLTPFDPGDVNPVLTFGSHMNVVQTGGAASISQFYNFANDGIVNDGTISAGVAGSFFNIHDNSIVNNGVISVTNGDTMTLSGYTFTEGAGSSFTVGSGSTLTLGVNLTTAQLTKITNSGRIEIGGGYGKTLTNTGATLTVGPGTADPVVQVNGNGEILGGTIVDKGSGIAFNGGTLSGVTFDGTMDLSESHASAVITGGLTEAGVNGTGAGAIDLNGGEGNLQVNCGETLDNATLTIGYQSRVFLFDPSGVTPDLTLGSGFDVADASNASSILTAAYGAALPTIINDGTITADTSHGGFLINVGALVNNGSIAVSNGDTLNLQLGTLTQGAKGTISVASGGTLDIAAALTTATLDQITNSGGTVGIAGTLTNTGSTLKVGPGTSEPAIVLQSGGVVVGGTIVDEGGGVHFNGGTLSGVTFEGEINMTPTYSTLYVTNGLNATDLNGAGPGTIDLGFLAFLRVAGSETLDNATVDLGYGNGIDLSDPGDKTPVLTFGSHLDIVQTGNGGNIGGGNYANDLIVNDGTINAAFTGGNNQGFSINPSNFTNNGSIIAGGGQNLAIQPGTFTNLSGTTLTGGSLEVDGASNIELNQNVDIATLDATVILNGAGSTLQSYNTSSQTQVGIDATLASIGKTGTLEILGGRNWTSPNAISNAGTVDLGGGTFTGPSLSSSGTVSGFGVLATKLTNNGALTVTGGDTLSLVGGSLTNLSGTTLTGGTYTVGAGGTLQLANNVSIATLAATIDLAGAGATIQSLNTTTSKEVSLASSLKTIAAGAALEILGGDSYTTTNTIANSGTVELVGGTLTAAALTNTGTLSGYGSVAAALTTSGTVSIQAGKTLSLQNGSLLAQAGATFIVGAGATFQSDNNDPLTFVDGTIDLEGVGSVIQSLNTTTSTEVTIEQSMTTIMAAGSLGVLGGRSYTTANVIANSGTVDLGGGTFTSGGLTDAAGSTLTGFGVVAGPFSDAGAVTASGGALTFTGTGDTFSKALGGTQIVFGGGTDLLQSGSTLTAGLVAINGGSAVTLAANQAFAGNLTAASGTTLALGANTLTLTGSGTTLAGAITGTGGTLALAGGTQSLNSGASLTVSKWSLSGGDAASLNEKLTFGGVFSDAAGTSLTVGSGDVLTLNAGGALVNGGTINLTTGATAELVLGANTTLSGGGTVALGSGNLNRMEGTSASTVLVNVDNTIVGSGLLGVKRLTLTNQAKGVIEASVGTIALQTNGETVVNTGLMEAVGGGHLNIQATVVNSSGGGVLSAADGSTVNLRNATLIGGTLTSAGSGDFATFFVDNVIDGTTSAVTNESTVKVADGTQLTMQGQVINSDRILVSAVTSRTHLTVGSAGLTLTGAGTVTLSNNADNFVSGATATATLTNVDNTIAGAGQLGDGKLTLNNEAKGVIDASGSTALLINTGTATLANAGLIEAVGSGGATVFSAINSTGTLEAAGGTLTIDKAVTGTGSAVITGGTLDLLSTFSQAVSFTGKSGVLELARSQSYTGSITGFSKTGGTSLDLGDIAFKSSGEATFSGTTTSGVLTVTDGTHTARITLIGDYIGSTFTASSDGKGGTIVIDPTAAELPAAAAPPPHQFIAAAATLGARAGGPVGAVGEVHSPVLNTVLAAPRLEIA